MYFSQYLQCHWILSIIGILIQRNTAEHLLPIFQELWYDTYEGYELIETNSCGIGVYNYTLASYDSFMVSNAPIYPNCTWDYNPIRYYNSTSQPPGFITSNSKDWNSIISVPNAPITQHYQWACKDKSGNKLFYYEADISPFYDCPPNTRLVFNADELQNECDTTAIPCVSDVVARDLKVPRIKDCGHIGLITSFGSYDLYKLDVLEVLNDPPGIFLTPFHGDNNSFISASKYWGERYGITGKQNIDLVTAFEIIASGTDQMQYNFNYSYTWSYYPGGTLDHPENCYFRCDSFVLYSYLSNGLIIQDHFSFPDSPKTMFNNFICSADPMGDCPHYYRFNTSQTTNHDNVKSTGLCAIQSNPSSSDRILDTDTSMIFKLLRSILLSKHRQRSIFPKLIEKYQHSPNLTQRILFARCLCFELKKLNPEDIDSKVKPIITEILLQYKEFILDNFLLAIMEKSIRYYIENPLCNFLSALFTAKAEETIGKTDQMLAFVDDEKNVIRKANLISSSGSALKKILSNTKKCEYGALFQYAYKNNNLKLKERKIIWSALATLGAFSIHNNVTSNAACRNIKIF